MSDIIDTLLNMSVFLFVGLMIWLYFKDTPGAPSQNFEARAPEEHD
jgi:hypothetical protein